MTAIRRSSPLVPPDAHRPRTALVRQGRACGRDAWADHSGPHFPLVKGGAIMWKRGGSGKPQQNAAAMCDPSLVEQTERQAAVDRSRCSRLLSSGSQVRVLPGASSGGSFGSGMSAIALADGHVRMMLWKRRGSAGVAPAAGGGALTTPRIQDRLKTHLSVPVENAPSCRGVCRARGAEPVGRGGVGAARRR